MCNRKIAVDIIVRVTHETTTYAVYIVICIRAHMCVADFGNGCASQNTLQWRHNERSGVLNQQRLDCLRNRFYAQIKENIKAPHFWSLWGESPAQRFSNTGNASIWWRHHETVMSGDWSIQMRNTCTVECRYNAVQYCKILHKKLQELRQKHQSDAGSTKGTPLRSLTGELCGVYCEYLWEKLPRNNGTALYNTCRQIHQGTRISCRFRKWMCFMEYQFRNRQILLLKRNQLISSHGSI